MQVQTVKTWRNVKVSLHRVGVACSGGAAQFWRTNKLCEEAHKVHNRKRIDLRVVCRDTTQRVSLLIYAVEQCTSADAVLSSAAR